MYIYTFIMTIAAFSCRVSIPDLRYFHSKMIYLIEINFVTGKQENEGVKQVVNFQGQALNHRLRLPNVSKTARKQNLFVCSFQEGNKQQLKTQFCLPLRTGVLQTYRVQLRAALESTGKARVDSNAQFLPQIKQMNLEHNSFGRFFLYRIFFVPKN